MSDPVQDNLLETYQTFPARFGSAVLATVSAEGLPQASYAPCIVDEDRNIYVFVSGLSAHTRNLTAISKASVLFIEDESKTQQIFARMRLSYDCTATLLERESEPWRAIAQQFENRFGNIVEVMRGLADFRIFQLQPQSGNFVVGFGAAYKVDPEDLSKLIHRSQ